MQLVCHRISTYLHQSWIRSVVVLSLSRVSWTKMKHFAAKRMLKVRSNPWNFHMVKCLLYEFQRLPLNKLSEFFLPKGFLLNKLSKKFVNMFRSYKLVVSNQKNIISFLMTLLNANDQITRQRRCPNKYQKRIEIPLK